MSAARHPRLAYLLVLFPWTIAARLRRLEDSAYSGPVPNLWQVGLGVLRMLHRLTFRSDTIGTCRAQSVRDTWRARVLHNRLLRTPFLLAERAIFPFDLSGLASTRENTITHLLAAHHDGNQFAYDLEMLAYEPGGLQELSVRVDAVVSGCDPRSEWLRDLVVFEAYHEKLQSAVYAALDGDLRLSADDAVDPDVSFSAYLAWCAAQPATPRETIRALRQGTFVIYEPSGPASGPAP